MSELYNSNEWFKALEQFGLGFLTFESCSISLRGLFDMSDYGIRLVERAFSISVDRDDTPRNWNSKVGNLKAIASIKLSPGQVRDLLIFALAERHEYIVYAKPEDSTNWNTSAHVWAGSYDEFQERKDYLNSDIGKELWSWHVFISDHDHPRVGLDNTHAFSGRSR